MATGDEAQQLLHLTAWASTEMADQGLISYRHDEELGKTFVGYEPQTGYMELSRA